MYFSAKSSLSSKLASRAKNFVEETPEKASLQRVSHFPTRGVTVDLTSSPKKVTLLPVIFRLFAHKMCINPRS